MPAPIYSSIRSRLCCLLSMVTIFAALLGLILPVERLYAACTPSLGFAPRVAYSIGSGTIQSVALGDLNGDGRLDHVFSNYQHSTVGVRLASGAPGTFGPLVEYATGADPYSVAVGDLNGDGRLDLAVANKNTLVTLSVLLGNGDGTFQSKIEYPTGGSSEALALGDLNGDGRLDVAFTIYPDKVSVLLGNGTPGLFAGNVDYSTGGNPREVAISDLNGDGRPDLAVANHASDTVSVLLASGAPGTFAAKVDYPTGDGPYGVAIGDLDNDGRSDLVVTNTGSDNVSVLLASGAPGTFAPKVDYTVGTAALMAALGDLNGDGRLDLAVNDRLGEVVSILLANGTPGTFAPKVDYPAGIYPVDVALGDLNNDGKLDMVIANDVTIANRNAAVSVLIYRPPPASLAIAVPASTPANTAFSSTVTVLDSCGNTLTGYTGPVTVVLKSGSGTSGAVLGGTHTLDAVNGVVTFNSLTIDRDGTGYVLTASAETASSDSPAFSVQVTAESGYRVYLPLVARN